MKKKLIIITSIITVLTAITYLLFYYGYLRLNYPSYDEFPVQGIDISHHQGAIEWTELSEENISFVFIKATEGGDFKDPKFQENWQNAQKYDFTVGAYHFYRLCKTGQEQALHFIATVPAIANTLPPSVDLEFGGNCKTNKSDKIIMQELQNYLNILTEHYGKKPIIYATMEFYKMYLQNRFEKYPIWIRDIYGRPELKNGRQWTFWQFANRGHLKGIKGFVDLNVFNGNRKLFEQLIIDHN